VRVVVWTAGLVLVAAATAACLLAIDDGLQERLVSDATMQAAWRPKRSCHAELCRDESFDEALARVRARFPPDLGRRPRPDQVAPALARALYETSRTQRLHPSPDPALFDRAIDGVVGLESILLLAKAGLPSVAQLPPDDAVAACVDAIALGRDMALSGAIFGDRAGAKLVSAVIERCDAVFAAADAVWRRSTVVALERIVAGWPTICELMRLEQVSFHLRAFGPFLSDARRAKLPPEAATVPRSPRASRWLGLASTYTWWRFERNDRAVLSSCDAPPAVRARLLDELLQDDHVAGPLDAVMLEPHDAALAKLDALIKRLQ
jgi:hypothetical protein